MAETKRRARGEDSIHYDRGRDRWTGTITVGSKPDGRRDRITVRSKRRDDRLGHSTWSRLEPRTEAAAKGKRLWPYVAVSMLGRIRTEEARVYPCVAPALRVSSHGTGTGPGGSRGGEKARLPLNAVRNAAEPDGT